MSESFWRVAVDAPLSNPLTYADFQLDAEGKSRLKAGVLVKVPLGRRQVEGLVLSAEKVETPAEEREFAIKSILEIDESYPQLPEYFLKWLDWISSYYIYPLGQLIGSIYPPLKKTDKVRKSNRPSVIKEIARSEAPPLTEEQNQVIQAVSLTEGFQAHLVFGVTGSGKTEIYMNLLDKVLKQGKSGMVIVPEIALTPQLSQRFVARFGDQVAVLHSQLTDRERTTQWWEVIEGRKRILVGARSALFCPMKDLGIIIVDEEHEPSFKQEEKLKYHGRDAAVMRAFIEKCPVILGSATPSLESWKNAIEGKYKLHRLARRVADRSMPEAEIIDLKREKVNLTKRPDWMPHWMTTELYSAIETTLNRNQQVALFLNRRGFANIVLCPACGFVRECPNCDISLTLHGKKHLVCHYCDYREDFVEKCSHCGQGENRPQGLGTEQLEEDMQKLFPEKVVARADRDEIDSREGLEVLIADMESSKIDILVGTQMIAKGLDFPNLTLVGIVLADIGLNMPDFRASERSFQLITQVSGRAGRHVKEGEEPGKVVIQTFNPEHFSITSSAQSNFEMFAEIELGARRELGYPPYGRLLSFRIIGSDMEKARKAAQDLSKRCWSLQKSQKVYEAIEILGPAEAPMFKVRNQYRYQLLLKGSRADILNSFAIQVLGDEKWLPTGSRINIDVDPLTML